MNPTCLSYWFPKLQAAGLPVPQTEIIRTALDLIALLDGKAPDRYDGFLAELRAAAARLGYPVFLRTGQGSGKHEWERTCFVPDEASLPSHVAALVEWSHLVDFFGLATDVWAVREMLPTVPQCTAFRGMPICREFRFFVEAGTVLCWHPYWPKRSLEEGFRAGLPERWPERYQSLATLPAIDERHVHDLARSASRAVGEWAWSVDILETRRGWFVTDMALADQSFHWSPCMVGAERWPQTQMAAYADREREDPERFPAGPVL